MSNDGNGVGRLIFEIFRLNGGLLAAGDALVGPLGLSSARWQVLWAMDIAGRPEPVAHLARTMGLTRQGVQRIVNELVADGLVGLAANPHHARARLVVFTPKGREVYDAAEALRRPWLAALAADLVPADVEKTLALLGVLRARLG